MFDKRKDHGNDVMVAPFVFLFLTRTILRVTLKEMDVKTANVTAKKKNLCSETTRQRLVVPLEF